MKKTIITMIFASIVSAQAATVSWGFTQIVNTGSNKNITGTGYLKSDGDVVFAQNIGGSAITFDGIDFSAGSFNYGATFGGFHDAISPITATGTYTANPVTVTFGTGGVGGALIEGQEYRIQAILMDGRGIYNNDHFHAEMDETRSTEIFAGQGQGSTNWGDALLATGVFTADNSGSQTFVHKAFKSDNTTAYPILNALVLQTVPEPSSSVLFGLGGLMLILRRRRELK